MEGEGSTSLEEGEARQGSLVVARTSLALRPRLAPAQHRRSNTPVTEGGHVAAVA